MRNPAATPLLGVTLVAVFLFAAVVLALPPRMIADEWVHFVQAQMFAQGHWQIHPELSTWPTVNLIVAGPLLLFGAESLLVARATIAAFALVGAIGFFLLAAHFDQRSAPIKTAQIFLLPIVLPYCGLVYTDIPALAAIVWMFYGAVRQRSVIFALAAVCAIAFRQVNVVWFAAAFALHAWQLRATEPAQWTRRLIPLLAFGLCIGIAWTLIVWRLGGIALTPSAQEGHRPGFDGLPNVQFAIALSGVLFAPILWSVRARMLALVRKPAGALLLVVLFLFVAFTFVVTHPYNVVPEIIEPYLRNRILFQIVHTPLLWVFAAVVAIATFAFGLLPFCPGAAKFKIPLYVIGLAALLPVGVIEQRYYLPLFTLFWAFRAPVSDRLELIQLALNVVLSIALMVLITTTMVFL